MLVTNKIFMDIATPEALNAESSREDIFTNLVNSHIDEIYNFAYYMVLDRDEAEDIAQKTFLSLFQNLSKLDFQKPIRAWLYKVARNNCLDYLKKKKALRFSEIEDEQTLEIPAEDASVESQLDDQLFIQKFTEHLKQLPSPFKEVILLKCVDDLTFEQIAEIQNLPLNTVKSHFYRGKIKLYNVLKS